MSNLIGQTFLNQFRVEAFIASGGMGAVYRVTDLKRNYPLAMKVLHADLADDPTVFKRFQREAQALQKLRHPNVVPFYGLFQEKGQTFLLEEFIEGNSLQAILRERNGLLLPVDEVIVYMKGLCAALHYAHTNNIVHCDVKPGNVMVNHQGKIFLTDFGIARFVGATTTTTLGIAGTPSYMAPEQIVGRGISPLTDIYALGVILFEMLTGQRPFRGTEPETAAGGDTPSDRIRYAHLRLPPPNPRQINPNLSPTLAQVVLRALEKNPAARFRGAQEFFNALCYVAQRQPEQISDETTIIGTYVEPLSPPVPPTPNTPRPMSGSVRRQKNIALVFVASTLMVLFILGAALMIIDNIPELAPTPPTIMPINITETETPSSTPTMIMTFTEIVTLTPTETQTPPLSTYDLAFVSDRNSPPGNLRAFIVNSSNLNDHIAFENPSGYEQAKWPTFCDGLLAIEVIDTDKIKRQWIFLHDLISPSSAPVGWDHARKATELGVPRCSPNGRYIAYSAMDKNYDFFIAQIRDGKIIYEPNTQSYGKIAGYASWVSNSSSIIFMVYKTGGSVVLRAMPNSSDLHPLDLGITTSHAAISPDGKKIAFTCDSENNNEKLCVFDTITSNTQKIYDTDSNVKITNWTEKVTPVWSMDGQWIYFATVDGGDWDIFRIHSDGSGVENVTWDWTSNEMMPATR